jgi:ribosomal-protein-alanine N-acetyltransferase
MWNPFEIEELDLGGIIVKKMEPKDLDGVLSIASSSPNPWSGNMFVEEMRNPFSHCFVIKVEEISKHQWVGFICFRNIADESELLNICVHPRYRQLGIGKKLMQFYIDFCRQINIKTFHLEVNASNLPATHLYRSFSYQSVGMRKNFYGEGSDALRMIRRDSNQTGKA